MDSSEEDVSRDSLPGLPPKDSEGSEDGAQSITAASSTRSISVSSNSQDVSADGRGEDATQGHQHLMLASLMEDYFRSRVAETLNATDPTRQYDRFSPEVQGLARQLFSQAGQALVSSGNLSALAISDTAQSTRTGYLFGLDQLAAGSPMPDVSIENPLDALINQASQLALVPHPANDLQLTIASQTRPPSHYQSSFREGILLGKGGFGRVYQCYNPLDQKTYAVKKIPLSAKLGRRFCEGKHDELQHVLREVTALAQLDHPNIVRYHATWFEEPQGSPPAINRPVSKPSVTRRPTLLLDSHAYNPGSESHAMSQAASYGIVFGEDTAPSQGPGDHKLLAQGPQWSEVGTSQDNTTESFESTSNDSDIFTDGNGGRSNHAGEAPPTVDDNSHMLYIQMSLYPMTLAHYISPIAHTGAGPAMKHCFHLLPTLRLLQSTLTGLRHIHAKGLIHRDIKPGNIFLAAPEMEVETGYCDISCKSCLARQNEDGTGSLNHLRWLNPRIGDFGLVAQLARGEVPPPPPPEHQPDSSSLSHRDDQHGGARSGSAALVASPKPVGTAYYRPPPPPPNSTLWEHGRAYQDDEKIDIFALGVVLVEMLCRCGTAMERVDMLKDLQKGRLPAILRSNVEKEGYTTKVQEKLECLAQGMVHPDPAERFDGEQVYKWLVDVLNEVIGGS